MMLFGDRPPDARQFETGRREAIRDVFARLNGKLSEEDREYFETAFRRWQNKILHGPIRALREESHAGGGHALLEALRKLFRLQE